MLSFAQGKDFPFGVFTISAVQQATLIGRAGVGVIPNDILQAGAETSFQTEAAADHNHKLISLLTRARGINLK